MRVANSKSNQRTVRLAGCRPLSVVLALALFGASSSSLHAIVGPYSTHSDDPTNPYDAPIAVDDPRIVNWASSVVEYLPGPRVDPGFDVPTSALGESNGLTVSLGDLDADQIAAGDSPGSITLGFSQAIRNGSGADFVVIGNAFTFFDAPEMVFGEFAYVEVSTDGINFARFASEAYQAEEDMHTPFGRDFAGVDARNYYNLAGKHAAGWGTPFDLEELVTHELVTSGLLDLQDIQYLRLIDIPGDGSFLDSNGNPIYDAWVTDGSGGFDLDAVGVINQVPEPGALVLLSIGAGALLVRRRR